MGKAGWTYVVDMVGIADACGQKVIPAPGLDLRKPRGVGGVSREKQQKR